MLELQNVSKVFDSKKAKVTAVNNVSLKVNEGEIYGLIGTNGAGKTTIMRMIATMLKPTAGVIKVMGKDVTIDPVYARKNIGILFGGDAGLYDRLTAYENIEYFALLSGMDKISAKERIEELAEFFNIKDYINRQCGKFSKGMKQKVCFARAIVHNPQVMLFDEPTSGLDIIAAEEVLNFMKDCRKKGKTILLSSHDMAEVSELCEKISIIKSGKILVDGYIDDLLKEYNEPNVKSLFLSLTAKEDINEEIK